MPDDRDHQGTQPAQPRPPSPQVAVELWTFSRSGHRWSAQLQVQGPWGHEVQILRNGKLRLSRRFPKRSLAEAWARAERTALDQGLP